MSKVCNTLDIRGGLGVLCPNCINILGNLSSTGHSSLVVSRTLILAKFVLECAVSSLKE